MINVYAVPSSGLRNVRRKRSNVFMNTFILRILDSSPLFRSLLRCPDACTSTLCRSFSIPDFSFWALSIKLIKRALDSSKIESEGGLVLDLLISIAWKTGAPRSGHIGIG